MKLKKPQPVAAWALMEYPLDSTLDGKPGPNRVREFLRGDPGVKTSETGRPIVKLVEANPAADAVVRAAIRWEKRGDLKGREFTRALDALDAAVLRLQKARKSKRTTNRRTN